MPRDRRAYLWDMAQAARLIGEFTQGKSLADHRSNAMLRSAVERQFEIIGEALNQATKHFPELIDEISHGRRIVAFRNRLIHAYASVADDVVWGVIETGLPILRQEVDDLMAQG